MKEFLKIMLVGFASGAALGTAFGLFTLDSQGHSGHKETQGLAVVGAIVVLRIAMELHDGTSAMLLAFIATATFIRDFYLFVFEPAVLCVPISADGPSTLGSPSSST